MWWLLVLQVVIAQPQPVGQANVEWSPAAQVGLKPLPDPGAVL